MKYRTTAKEVKEGYYKQICIGYADLQELLRYIEPVAYTCGVYGWNANIYDMYNLTGFNCCIVTGYRPFGNVKSDYEYNRKMEEKAKKISNNYNLTYNQRKAYINRLLKSFIEHYRKEWTK